MAVNRSPLAALAATVQPAGFRGFFCRFGSGAAGIVHAGPTGVHSAQQAPLVLAIFVATQVLDGMLTYWGVSRFGVHIEFNSWLATLMNAIGPAPALLAAKSLACLCGVVLFATTSFRVLAVATGWCLGFAVVPWVALALAFI
jgi:hypothetical protein